MNIQYKENEIPNKEAFFDLFESTGWNKEYHLTAAEIHTALSASWYMVSVYKENRLVGFGRVLSDGKLHALITEMIIFPQHQGLGIGKKILEMLTAQCKAHEIRDIQLFSARGKAGFYEKYGFSSRPENAPGMEIKLKMYPATY
ncbi:MAG: GNAT family N-acetyltransferase [bacterium]|nr:GNAT family N-acetyltransferase [bacterium]